MCLLLLPWLPLLVLGACGSDETNGSGGAGASGTGGDAGAGGDVGPQACDSLSDCPQPDPSCGTWTDCEDGECVGDLEPQGTVVPNIGKLGDCQQEVCDGQGQTATVADDRDSANDYNPCTEDSCVDGRPTFVAANDGDQCGSSNDTVCQAGECVGCKSDGQCPQGDSCMTAVCQKEGGLATGTCAFENATGKEVANADATDCVHAVCDENGGIIVLGNLAEVPPPDENDCDIEACTESGAVEHQPLDDGVACGGATFCNPSACAEAVCEKLDNPPDGTLTPGQTGGDCSNEVCDGQGGVKTVPAPAGTGCTGGLLGVCNASGTCT